jgi:hypothetical protein
VARLQAARMLASRAAAAGDGAMEAEPSVVAAADAPMADTAAEPAAGLSAADASRVSASLREAASALLPGDASAASALAARDGVALAAALAAAAPALAASLPPAFLAPLLSRADLDGEDLAALTALNESFCEEYAMRREMLVRRVDCTLDAMMTSPRTAAPARRAEAMRAVAPERAAMSVEAGVRYAKLMLAFVCR